MYGCGDLLNDYEGISGHDEFRDELSLMYFPVVSPADGTLLRLNAAPMQASFFLLFYLIFHFHNFLEIFPRLKKCA